MKPTTHHQEPSTKNQELPSPQPPRVGRPTTLTPDLVERLCSTIAERGISDTAAARVWLICPSTLSGWKSRNIDLALALVRAREEFRDRHLQTIQKASIERGGWRAAAWLLERVFPEDYATRFSERTKSWVMQDGREVDEAPDYDVEAYAQACAAAAHAKRMATTTTTAPSTADFRNFRTPSPDKFMDDAAAKPSAPLTGPIQAPTIHL